jgi:hypothetical protein
LGVILALRGVNVLQASYVVFVNVFTALRVKAELGLHRPVLYGKRTNR